MSTGIAQRAEIDAANQIVAVGGFRAPKAQLGLCAAQRDPVNADLDNHEAAVIAQAALADAAAARPMWRRDRSA